MLKKKNATMTRRDFAACAGATGLLAAGALLGGCTRANENDSDSLNVEDKPEEAEPSPEEILNERIDSFVETMSLEEKIAQLFVVRPETITGFSPTIQAGDATKQALESHPVCGITYFADNLIDPDQTKSMLAKTLEYGYAANGLPLLLAVDEEGGTVSRIADNAAFGQADVGDAVSIAAAGSTEAAKDAAKTIAGYLKPLGFNLDFAPVFDIANNPESNTMAKRSFGSDAQLVADMATAEVEAFLDADMLCCAKHFPGIGAAKGDSHEQSIYTDKTLDEMLEVELVPFKAGIEAGVPLVMVGHLSAPQVTGDDTPASLSRIMVTDVLRGKLGYEGVVITDALEMAAAGDVYSNDEVALLAIEAGCDIALMPPDYEAAFAGVLNAVETGRLDEARIDESLRRILRVKLSYLDKED